MFKLGRGGGKPWIGSADKLVKKYGWVFLILGNIVIAFVVSTVYSSIQQAHPALSSATATPLPSATETVDPISLPSPTQTQIHTKTQTQTQQTQTHTETHTLPPAPTSTPTPEPLYNLHPQVATAHWLSWAILDEKTGVFAGSENWDQPSYLMASIKPWIAADYFNLHPNPSTLMLTRLSTMIMNGDDQIALQYFGGQSSLDRLSKACGITEIVYRGLLWSLTEISARDSARYGQCIYSGKATSPSWTAWIVDKMRHVRGDGDFGPRKLFQDRTQVATSNGWRNWHGKWYVNCLAVTDDWSIAILQQWPYSGGDSKYGIDQADPICNSITSQVLRLSS